MPSSDLRLWSSNEMALEEGGPRRLRGGVSHNRYVLCVDEVPVVSVPLGGGAVQQRVCVLGHIELEVVTFEGWLGPEIGVFRNGRPLHGSAAHPREKLKFCAWVHAFHVCVSAALLGVATWEGSLNEQAGCSVLLIANVVAARRLFHGFAGSATLAAVCALPGVALVALKLMADGLEELAFAGFLLIVAWVIGLNRGRAALREMAELRASS